MSSRLAGREPRILLVEDDAELRDLLRRGLGEEGFAVFGVGSAARALEHISEADADALIIDIGLPDADGRDLCQTLRARGVTAPVIFLTARDAVTDRLAGFGAGGDDYVTKPFSLAEVAARLRALLKRARTTSEVHDGGLMLDPVAREIRSDDIRVSLTPTEFRLLAALAARPGATLSRIELVRAAWPEGAVVHDNTLDVFLARLRRKLRQLPEPRQIGTIYGHGYRLT